MKKIFSLLLLVLLCSVNVSAFDISARSAIVIDSLSGRVLYEKNSREHLPMASTTKIMTGLLACESGKMSDIVTVSPVASGTEGSSLWLKIGEKMSLENLTYGLMLKSGNDAAVAIAEYLAGSVDAFSLLMNKRAKEIGVIDTCFKNPNGLAEEEHFTTAYDLAQISRVAMQNEQFAKIVSTKEKTIPWEGEEWDRVLKNHNKMLWQYEGCNGIKTGFVKKSGRCLVTSAKRGKTSIICVTLNAPSDWSDHKVMLDSCFNKFSSKVVCKKGEKMGDFIYDEKKKKSVALVAEKAFLVAVTDNDNIKTQIEYKNNRIIKKGSVGAIMHVFVNDEKLGSVNLVYRKSIKKKFRLVFSTLAEFFYFTH